MARVILVCNAGSNSLKCAVYTAGDSELQFRCVADRIHDAAQIEISNADGEVVRNFSTGSGYRNAMEELFQWMRDAYEDDEIVAAGHRIVHGGSAFQEPVIINGAVRQTLEELVPLAPLHQPHHIRLIDTLTERFPDIPQTACFDTTFHSRQPSIMRQYALPRELTESEQIYQYGFHGLSYEYIAGILPEWIENVHEKKVIVLHLGGGASACAMINGKSIATTMGFSALDGLMMATRCGSIDPGVLLYLMKEKHMRHDQLEELLYQKSGLLGVSDISGDMRDLDDNPDEKAQEAVELFALMAAEEIGRLMIDVGGMDVLVFTGAMGKHDAIVRSRICGYLNWLSLELDEFSNRQDKERISTQESAVRILALETDEEVVIARHTAELLDT